jgi:predicted PurR-regulated permease PerM
MDESGPSREEPARDRAPSWLPRAVISIALVLIGILALLFVVNRLRGLLFILFISLFVSVALEPAVQRLTKRGWKRRPATMAVFTVATIITIGFFASMVPLFINQVAQLVPRVPSYLAALQDWLSRFVDIELTDAQLAAQFRDLGTLVRQYGGQVAGGIFAVGNTIVGGVFQMVTVALFSYYMVAEGPTLRRVVLSVLPPARQREVMRGWELAVDKTGGYVYSRALLALVAGGFTWLVLTILGVDFAFALSLWVGVVSQFVPVIGTYIAMVLPLLVAFFDRPSNALWVLIALVAYQQVENYVVAPRITARAMAIHPAISFGAVLAGASLLGGIGAVLALPVAATIQAFISTIVRRHDLIAEAGEVEPARREPRRRTD